MWQALLAWALAQARASALVLRPRPRWFAGRRSCRDRLTHGAELAARDGQQFLDAVQAHCPAFTLFRVEMLFERANGAPRDQRIAMHAQELRGMAVLQFAQRRIEDIA